MRQLGLFADMVALGIVVFMKVTPPFGGMRKEFAYLFGWSFEMIYRLGCVGAFLFGNLWHINLQKGLLLAAGYAVFADMAKVCKTSVEDSKRIVRSAITACGIVSCFVYGLWRICQSMIPLTGFLHVLASIAAALVIIALLGWWAVRQTDASTIQELKLNE
ncbi:MAG: hypothetical protein WCE73_11620 [Candidatus Angelobacter sp.]